MIIIIIIIIIMIIIIMMMIMIIMIKTVLIIILIIITISLKKLIEAHFNTSEIFLLYFYDAYDVSVWEIVPHTASSYKTNLFTEFHHFMKKE